MRASRSVIRSLASPWRRETVGCDPRDLATGLLPRHRRAELEADYGNETANHYDHVHIATVGGGYPTGRETYFIESIRRTPN